MVMVCWAGNELENVMKNPSLNDLVGGISSVTLGDEEAKRRRVRLTSVLLLSTGTWCMQYAR